jgi:cytochrome P450
MQWADENSKRSGNGEKGETSFISTMTRVQIPFQAALSEAKEMLGPGTDTTSATLAHILWALSLNQSFQAELVSDLATAGWPIDMAQLEAIPRLVACVKEGIRWTGAAAAMLPRVVPRGGTRLGGKFLPGGVCSMRRVSIEI